MHGSEFTFGMGLFWTIHNVCLCVCPELFWLLLFMRTSSLIRDWLRVWSARWNIPASHLLNFHKWEPIYLMHAATIDEVFRPISAQGRHRGHASSAAWDHSVSQFADTWIPLLHNLRDTQTEFSVAWPWPRNFGQTNIEINGIQQTVDVSKVLVN